MVKTDAHCTATQNIRRNQRRGKAGMETMEPLTFHKREPGDDDDTKNNCAGG